MRTEKTTELLKTVQELEEHRRNVAETEEPIRILLRFVLGAEQYALKVEDVSSINFPFAFF